MSVCWSNASTQRTTERQNVLRILLSRRPVRVHRERASSVDVSCSGMMKTQSNGGIHNSDGLLYFIPQEDHSSNMCLVAPLVHEYAGPETHEEYCHALPVGKLPSARRALRATEVASSRSSIPVFAIHSMEGLWPMQAIMAIMPGRWWIRSCPDVRARASRSFRVHGSRSVRPAA